MYRACTARPSSPPVLVTAVHVFRHIHTNSCHTPKHTHATQQTHTTHKRDTLNHTRPVPCKSIPNSGKSSLPASLCVQSKSVSRVSDTHSTHPHTHTHAPLNRRTLLATVTHSTTPDLYHANQYPRVGSLPCLLRCVCKAKVCPE